MRIGLGENEAKNLAANDIDFVMNRKPHEVARLKEEKKEELNAKL